jgi:hypothetical protein
MDGRESRTGLVFARYKIRRLGEHGVFAREGVVLWVDLVSGGLASVPL